MMGKEEKRMNQNLFEERENLSEENAAKKNRRNNIIAFVICVFLAFSNEGLFFCVRTRLFFFFYKIILRTF